MANFAAMLESEAVEEWYEGRLFENLVSGIRTAPMARTNALAWATILDLDERSTQAMAELLLHYGDVARTEAKQVGREFGITDSESFMAASVEDLRDSLEIRHLILRDKYLEFVEDLRFTLRSEEFERYTDLCRRFKIAY